MGIGPSRNRMMPQLTQENIVFAIAAVFFVGFSLLLPGFFDTSNLLSLIQNVSILGILGIGMGIVVIGRGIDLTMVATMVRSMPRPMTTIPMPMPRMPRMETF